MAFHGEGGGRGVQDGEHILIHVNVWQKKKKKMPFQQGCTASWNRSWHFTKLLTGKRQVRGRRPMERAGLDFCPGWNTGPQTAIAFVGNLPFAGPSS